MNRMQESTIEGFRRSVDRWCGDRYEVKRWEIDEIGHGKVLCLIAETGLPNDEGTMGEIFARDRAMIFIGPSGGITYPVFRRGHQYERRMPFPHFLKVVVEQREDGKK